jgi:hypothetical protein
MGDLQSKAPQRAQKRQNRNWPLEHDSRPVWQLNFLAA